MALRPDVRYNPADSCIDAFMTSTAERGGIVSTANTTASGVALDQAANTVEYAASLSGVKPRGMLVVDVVNKDLSQTHLNFHKMEVQVNTKVTYVEKGEFTTDKVYPGHSPVPGGKAYLGHSGYIAASNVATDHSDTTGADKVVGRWKTRKDDDGFATVVINLP